MSVNISKVRPLFWAGVPPPSYRTFSRNILKSETRALIGNNKEFMNLSIVGRSWDFDSICEIWVF